MLTALGLTGDAAGALAVAAPPAPSPAEALARRIEARHRGVRDLTARFVQTYRSGALGREVVEKGVLSLKPPSRMRWEYRDPGEEDVRVRRQDVLLLRARRPAGDPCASSPTRATCPPCSSPATPTSSRTFDVALETGQAGLPAAAPHAEEAGARDRAPLRRRGRRRTASARSWSSTPRATAASSSSTTSARTWAWTIASSGSRCRAGVEVIAG